MSFESKNLNAEDWLTVCGRADAALAGELENLSIERMKAKGYTKEDVDYIRKFKQPLIAGGLDIEGKELEKLRTLCKLWDVELKCSEITSHRPIIGHFVVAAKKLMFPVIRVLLKDTFKQQRDFNAAAISMLADILNRKER